VNDFTKAQQLLTAIGCRKKAFQESKREIWQLDGVEITINEWPFLEPFVEIEGKAEKPVKSACRKLGFDYSKALFCSIDTLYADKYGFSAKVINNQTPRICFDMKNPFKL
jgi:adenylate cyclase class 2